MINRPLDKVGRLVIPQEMRAKLNITHNTMLDINLEGDKIIITKSGISCTLCGNTGDLLEGTTVCRSCAEAIAAKLAQA